MAVLVYAIVDATDAGWGSAQTLGLIGVAAALLAACVVHEYRSDAPLMPLAIFRNRTLSGANVVGLLAGGSLISMFFFITCTCSRCSATARSKPGSRTSRWR